MGEVSMVEEWQKYWAEEVEKASDLRPLPTQLGCLGNVSIVEEGNCIEVEGPVLLDRLEIWRRIVANENSLLDEAVVADEERICSIWIKKVKDCDGSNGRGGQCSLKDEKQCPKNKQPEGGK